MNRKRKRNWVSLIVIVVIVIIVITAHQNNKIINIFDELYYADARKKGSIIYLYMDSGSYKHDAYFEKDGSDVGGLEYIDWLTSTTSTGREYTIENAPYVDKKMSLKAIIDNSSDMTVEYEYYYDVRKKELHPNIYIYGLLRDKNGYEARREEAEKLVKEAKNIIDQFLYDLIVNNEGKTRYQTDNWGSYEIFPEQRMEYQGNPKKNGDIPEEDYSDAESG